MNRSELDGNAWKRAVAAAGIVADRTAGMHALRHFYASALLDAGETVKALAAYLGHTGPGFTLRVPLRVSGVQAGSSAALLVMAVELACRT